MAESASPREPRYLVVICGPPLAGKSTLAQHLGRSMPGKTAVIPHDDLRDRWIVIHDADARQEQAWMYMQVRLLVANFLRNGYSVIVEGAYLALHDGLLITGFEEIGGLFGLMASLLSGSQLVVVEAPLDTLQARLAASPELYSPADLSRLAAPYSGARLQGALRLDSSRLSVDQETERVLLALGLRTR
jgi:hypothetical protein